MSMLAKGGAVLLLVAAVFLGFLAYRMATNPVPPAPVNTPVSVPTGALSAPVSLNHPVVIATSAIPAGQVVTADALRVMMWPVDMPSGFATIDAVAGKILRDDVAAGEPILRGQLMAGLSNYLRGDERAVAIAVDELIGVSNAIAPGDLIDIFITLDKNDEVSGAQTRLMQSRVRVLAYGSRSLDGPILASSDATARAPAQVTPRTAVLAVPLRSVNELLLAAKAGRLHFALRAPGDARVPDSLLFVDREPVLRTRAGLTAVERASLARPENAAFAGESLAQLGGSPVASRALPVAPSALPVNGTPAPAVTGARAGGSRRVEIIRGGQSETQNY